MGFTLKTLPNSAPPYINLPVLSHFYNTSAPSMPVTYTHKFDTPTYKGDVTINTGCVLCF